MSKRTRKPENLQYYPVAEGHPEGKAASTKRIPVLSVFQYNNFFKKVEKTDTCWNWTGMQTRTGRGKLKLWGEEFIAARVSYAFTFNTDPGPWHCCHTCDNPSCVNPNHMWLGSHQDNVDDMHAKGRFVASRGNTKVDLENPEHVKILINPDLTRKQKASLLNLTEPHVSRLSSKLGKDFRFKLTEENIQDIITSNKTYKELAAKYNVHPNRIGEIRKQHGCSDKRKRKELP